MPNEALNSIRAHPLRAILTMLGIVWGIAAVIVLVSLISGYHREFAASLDEKTTRLIWVSPSFRTSERPQLWPSDVDLVMGQVGSVEAGTAVSSKGNVAITKGALSRSITVYGIFPRHAEVPGLKLDRGRFLHQFDSRENSRSIILGQELKEYLFGKRDAVGETVQLGRWEFRVVGVLEKGEGLWSRDGYSRSALIPYGTLSAFFTGEEEARQLVFRVRRGADDLACVQAVEAVLAAKHGKSPADEIFYISNAAENYRTVNRMLAAAKILVGAVGSITLLVAVVGVMNIMLVSVTERTREIGIRKSVGATRRALLRQFLAEALVLCGLGWVGGVLWGMLLAWLISLLPIPDFPAPYVSATNVLVSGLLVLVSGLLAGLLPAVRAARMQPDQALRLE